MRVLRFGLAVIFGVLSLAPSGATAKPLLATSPELLDYLIQDVCTDAQSRPIQGDPATCRRHRNIAIGEPSPYLVTDFEVSNGKTYSAMNSIPVSALDGNMRIIVTKSMQGNFRPGFRFSFDASRDGYDLIDITNSEYASFIRTSDGGCFDQIFSRRGSFRNAKDRAGGWILFPRTAPSTWPVSRGVPVTTYKIQLTKGRPGCNNGHSTGMTFWNRPVAYRFETDKALRAIRSDHFASGDLGAENNALERYYFTREYGFTRWEAWVPLARCFQEHGTEAAICHPERPDYALRGRCSVLNSTSSGLPGMDQWGNQTWVRVDCRDQTKYLALDHPQRLLSPTMARDNGVEDLQP